MPNSCSHWVEQFREDFFQRGSSETTWNDDYWKILKRLPMERTLTAKLLHDLVFGTEPNTKTRKRACMVTRQMADFARIKYDPTRYAGNYSPDSVDPRTIPTDSAIVESWEKLSNPGWKWVFGILATYGLRPHEAFYLSSLHLPPIKLDRPNSAIGRSAGHYFRDFGLPFRLMDLRHQWVIRTLEYGLNYQVAACMMGHSYQVHERIYHRWIDRKVLQSAYDRSLINHQNPPLPNSPG